MNDKPRFHVIQGSGVRKGPTRAESTAIAQEAFRRLVGADGTVRAFSMEQVHQILTEELKFAFVDKNSFGVLPGGHQLFYLRPNVLIRIKTKGTERRRRPHMTISLALGRSWDEEQAKLNKAGGWDAKLLTDQAPAKVSPFTVLTPTLSSQAQDQWADRTHFDFPAGFNDTAAATLDPDK